MFVPIRIGFNEWVKPPCSFISSFTNTKNKIAFKKALGHTSKLHVIRANSNKSILNTAHKLFFQC